jgi:hypothetical protein
MFQPLFTKLFRSWFWATWEEDAPMRLRRWKVHRLGFKDFNGIDYINKKTLRQKDKRSGPYVFDPPVRSASPIKTVAGIERPFDHSTEIGYADEPFAIQYGEPQPQEDESFAKP